MTTMYAWQQPTQEPTTYGIIKADEVRVGDYLEFHKYGTTPAPDGTMHQGHSVFYRRVTHVLHLPEGPPRPYEPRVHLIFTPMDRMSNGIRLVPSREVKVTRGA